MRLDRWLIVDESPGKPITVLAATDSFSKALAMYGAASEAMPRVQIRPNPDVVAEALLGDGNSEQSQAATQDTGEQDSEQEIRMATAAALLQLLRHVGARFKIRVLDDQPKILASVAHGLLTQEVRRALDAHKPEIIALLREEFRQALWREVLRRPIGGAAA